MLTDLEAVRLQLLLAIKEGRRFYGEGYPCSWHPMKVIDPETGRVFTPVGAWEFAMRLLGSGHDLEEVLLEVPKGKKGYVMKVDIGPKGRQLYIKLQLVGGMVVGRSFHYSVHEPGGE